jgi:catechol 2,3-dioxygenase-like lactoylglutathione lyase family enzyme
MPIIAGDLMKVLSLGWLGVRTQNSAAMTAFYRDVLGLEMLQEETTSARFCLADRTEVHVYDEFHEFFGSAPVIGFLVDSFAEAQAALLQAGIEFLYPEAQRHAGQAWQHFRAPDGNVYEMIGPDDLDAE